MQGEPTEQETEREIFTLDAAVSVTKASPRSSRCRATTEDFLHFRR